MIEENERTLKEQRASDIAQELVRYASEGGAKNRYAFAHGDKTFEVIVVSPSAGDEFAYMSTLPPGDVCGCCNGSGTAPKK